MTTNTYDSLARLLTTEVVSTDGKTDRHTFTYNKLGQQISADDITYEYDNLGQLVKESDGSNDTIEEYTYDEAGNRKTFRLTVGGVVQMSLQYSYTKLNLLDNIRGLRDNSVIEQYTYDNNGNLFTKYTPASKIKTTYRYNRAGQVKEVVITARDGMLTVGRYHYDYYANGNQSEKKADVNQTGEKTMQYTYDGLGRLTKEQNGTAVTAYQYDADGNRKQMSVTGTETPFTTNYTYDKNNCLLSETKALEQQTESIQYQYDPNGNMTSRMGSTIASPSGAQGVSISENGANTTAGIYEYNGLNQLTSLFEDGTTASYTYNVYGLRTSKTVNGNTTKHIWDGSNMIAETDVSGNVTDKYYRGISLVFGEQEGQKQYYLTNEHGDVDMLADSAGNITKTYTYDVFGNEQNKDEADTNPFRYRGEYFDNETDSIYLRARYYSPSNGRFLTEDPAKDGTNWYSYCMNNSVNYVDVTGLTTFPLRRLMQVLGGTISWDSSTQQAFVSRGIPYKRVPYYVNDGDGTYIANDIMYTSGESVYNNIGLNLTNREKAIVYARVYGAEDVHNPDFVAYPTSNCTNFVSQCLLAGGFNMDAKWWYDFDRSYRENSAAWGVADDMYRYLTGTLGFSVSYIPNKGDIFEIADRVNPGDVIGWNNFDEVPRGVINHMAIVSYTEDGNIYYCGNTEARVDKLLMNSDLNGDLYIVHVQYPD